MWVTQAETIRNGTSHHHIFMIYSGTMEIKTAYGGRPHADSADATVFFLDALHAGVRKTLRVEEVWWIVGSFNDGAKLVAVPWVPCSSAAGAGWMSAVQYEFFETGTFAVNPDMPLPVCGAAHDPYCPLPQPPEPPALFAFELV